VFVLSPEAFATCGKLLDALLGTSLTLSKLKLFQLGPKHAAHLSDLLSQQPEDDLAGHFSAHRILAGVALGDSAVQSVCDVTRHLNDRSLSAGGGQVAWCAADAGAAAELLDFLFGQQQQQRLGSTATFDSCTCCVIKPHAVKAGETGAILDHILSQGYEVSAVEMFHLDKASAAEFFEVYQGVAPEYKDLIDHVSCCSWQHQQLLLCCATVTGAANVLCMWIVQVRKAPTVLLL
jgi:nucleoside-diphosphate kinase